MREFSSNRKKLASFTFCLFFRIATDFRPFEIDGSGSDWNVEDGYECNQSEPLKAFKSNPMEGLVLNLIQYAKSGSESCPYDNSRLKFVVHSPGEFPTGTQNSFSVPYGHDLNVVIQPVMMTTTHDLLGYSTDVRQCYFNKERSLKFFKFYTEENCENECSTNFTRLACRCAKLSMPRDNNTELCGPEKYECLFGSDIFYQYTAIDGFEEQAEEMIQTFNLTSDEFALISTPCKCLPSCVSLKYELSITPFGNAFDGASISETSAVRFHFKSASFMKMKRMELYGWGDFIANCGGLLGKIWMKIRKNNTEIFTSSGLFMGVSILSVIELIYYSTLRIACTLNKNRVTDKVTTMKPSVEIKETNIAFEPEVIDWEKF